MIAKDIIGKLDKFAPENLIDSWDNTGFQVGDDGQTVKKILLSLDVDDRILDYAIDNKIDMIISHHPVIFSPINHVTTRSYKGSIIYKAIKNDIILYNAHSNLDQTVGGVNDVLADLFDLKNREVLKENIELDNWIYGYGKIGDIDNISVDRFLDLVKDRLDIDKLTIFGERNRMVNKLALCGGSGSSFIEDAAKKGADIYLTGDIKYHDAQEAVSRGLTIIDAGHFHTEKVILPKLKEVLQSELGGQLEFELYMESSPSYSIY